METNRKGGKSAIKFNKRIKADKLCKAISNALSSLKDVDVVKDHTTSNIALQGGVDATEQALKLVYAMCNLIPSWKFTFENGSVMVFLTKAKPNHDNKTDWKRFT